MAEGRGGGRFASLAAAPGVLYLALFVVLPLVLVAAYSFTGGGGVSAEAYGRAADPLYLRVLGTSVVLAGLTTALSLLLGVPAAWAIRGLSPGARMAVLALVVLPSWMNLLVKNYAWIVLLRREGVINTALLASGLTGAPLSLLFHPGAVLVGLVHTYLPFLVLPVYAAFERLDERQLEAARDLGASRWATFRRVALPQASAGIAAGCVLVFIPALGAFVTPALLGGTQSLMVGTLIENQVLQVRDWPFASALSVLLIALVMAALLLQRRWTGRAAEARLP